MLTKPSISILCISFLAFADPSEAAADIKGVCAAYEENPDDEQLNRACQAALKSLKQARANLALAQETAFGVTGGFTVAQKTERLPPAPLSEAKPQLSSDSASAGAPAKAKEFKATDTAENSFGGIKFGAGIGFTYDLGNRDRVKSATLVNGLIRVSEQENLAARLLLESHYFFTPGGKVLGLEQGDWGIGPFIALQGGSTKVIEGVGAGIMFGMKRLRANARSAGPSTDDDAKKDGSSFNIGLGVFYDLNVQTLGDGLAPNKPLPTGETEIRFTKRSQSGFLVLSSFAF